MNDKNKLSEVVEFKFLNENGKIDEAAYLAIYCQVRVEDIEEPTGILTLLPHEEVINCVTQVYHYDHEDY